MRNKQLVILGLLVLLPAAPPLCLAEGPAVESGISSQKAQAFIGQDLHLAGAELVSYQLSTSEHILTFQNGFSMSIGSNQFSSDSAVVWLESIITEFRGRIDVDYEAIVYLGGDVSVKKAKGTKTTDLSETVIEKGQAMVVRFGVGGEVFVTADKREVADPRGLVLGTPAGELYTKALAAVVSIEPAFAGGAILQKDRKMGIPVEAGAPMPERPERPPKEAITAKPSEPSLRYPVNIAPAASLLRSKTAGVGEAALKIEWSKEPDGTNVATVIGRLYVWQWQEVNGKKVLLELQADSAVIFSSLIARLPLRLSSQDEAAGLSSLKEEKTQHDILAGRDVKAIYMSGDIVMTEGQRTIRADEIYYDFQQKKAVAINAVMRNFDVKRGIPIYVRAAKLKQLAENKFAAENMTLTSSEFYQPQISLTASSVIIADTTPVDAQLKKVSDSSFDAQMRDVRLKVGDTTIFRWPFMRSNLQRPDIPLKSVHAGYDGTWGASLETRWYLSRLLGLREPEGTDSTFGLDYYGKRGLGSGVEIDYKRENYFGGLLGYIIHDTGEDRLGRHDSRKNLGPERELRGRFGWRHRQFLPYNWQLTTGINYSSDERFVEQYYRSEFSTGRRETYVHMKRLEDNWALSLLGKWRMNDFADELEELPGVEYHLTGQSLFDDKLTLYSDTQVSRLRQRIGDEHYTIAMNEDHFSFASHRTELDMPLQFKTQDLKLKIVPFVAGTFGYDDRSGFTRALVDGSDTGSFGEDEVWLGEAGVRVGTEYWKVYPDTKSRLWDLKGLRHIIKPQLTTVLYEETDDVVEQRDVLNVGVSQRLQTRRGTGDKQRTVDWMRLDMDVTWVNNSEDSISGPDRFIWNRPIVPLRILSAPDIFNGDLITPLQRFEMFGPRRNYFSADYVLRLSDTTAVLSDMNFDMQSGVVQQFNFGFSRMRWPDLSYYIGIRNLRRVEVLDEKGSNAFTFAATYVLDPRYTVVFSQQFDFDYGANIRSDITLIRRYHRLYCGLTYSADQSLDRQAIVFSIWPQGVPELAIGPRRYMGLSR